MRYIVRTIENGSRLGVEAVTAKRQAVYEKILATGLQYIETEGMLGSLDALGRRIEERVYAIEAVAGSMYV